MNGFSFIKQFYFCCQAPAQGIDVDTNPVPQRRDASRLDTSRLDASRLRELLFSIMPTKPPTGVVGTKSPVPLPLNVKF